jgi:hypothetical protein
VSDDPHIPTYPLGTYLWALWLSWWGAAAAYLQRIKGQGVKEFSIFSFLCEIVISGHVGILTLYLGDWQKFAPPLLGFAIGVAGHFSTRAMFLFWNMSPMGGGRR